MMYDELVSRLREADEKSMCGECGLNLHTGATKKGVLFAKAADAIEELSHEYESMAKSLNESVELVHKMQSHAADVAPVVRCNACAYRHDDGFCAGRGWPLQLVPDDGYCDRGARMDGGGEDGN